MGYDILTRKVVYITGTRADYGLMQSVLKNIDNDPNLDLEIVVTGMHLMEEFGYTLDEIKKDNFKIHIIDSTYEKDSKLSMAIFIGDFTKKLAVKIDEIKPDFILLLGDRGEMLSGAIVGAYLSIPTVHLHGGEITSTVDEIARHAITKLSHIHFPANERSEKRIIQMGEDPRDVYVVGAPGLDHILNEKLIPVENLQEKYGIEKDEPLLIVIQHPVTTEKRDAKKQMKNTLTALDELGYQTILIYPNADAGGREMIKEIKKFESKTFLKTFRSLPRKDYLSLLNIADVLVGNSSSGIIEATSFKLPVVNVGTRQSGREQAGNVINVSYDKEEIKSGIDKALHDEDFTRKLEHCENPYGDGKTGKRIVELLKKIEIDEKLLQKRSKFDV